MMVKAQYHVCACTDLLGLVFCARAICQFQRKRIITSSLWGLGLREAGIKTGSWPSGKVGYGWVRLGKGLQEAWLDAQEVAALMTGPLGHGRH